jgi:hypothetical protein
MIEPSEAAVVVDFRLRTVGLEEATASSYASISICVECTDLMAKGDEPSERTRPLDHLVYERIQEMVTNDPTFTFLSWIALRKGRGLPAPTLIEPKILRAWNDFKKVMALPPTLERGERAEENQRALKAG